MQKEDQSKLYQVLKGYIPKPIVTRKNKSKSWLYGYNEKYDLVIISKSGQLGDVININGLVIGLPLQPKKIYKRSEKKEKQYWERHELSKELSRINSIFQWNARPPQFKTKWVDYIEGEFDNRELGFWFYNNGSPCYITGSHYMYLQ